MFHVFFYGDNNIYHNFTVPTGVNFINAKLYGAQGGNGNIPEFMHDGEIYRGLPGKGGYIEAYLRVAETKILYLFVGKKGGDSSDSRGIGIGGFNGGGDGYNAGGGGGATDIRTSLYSLSSRIIVAGGGGGASQQSNGGNGGSSNPSYGRGDGNYGGFGGTAVAGGMKGKTIYVNSGVCPIYSCLLNSDGGVGYGGSGGFQAQGGGGGGYYGGGAGGTWGGGGGGSNYMNTKKGTLISQSVGSQNGNGLIVLSYFM